MPEKYLPTAGGTGFLTTREKIQRHLKLLPANALHSWKMTSTPFRLLFLVTTAISVLLVLSEMKVRDLSRLNNLRSEFNNHPIPAGRRTASCTSANPCRIQMVADMDTRSLISNSGEKPKYISKLIYGRVHFEGDRPIFQWGSDLVPHDVVGKLSEDGRGMELSELVLWKDQLLSFDDRTGIVFELLIVDSSENTTYSLPNYLSGKGDNKLSPGQYIDSVPRYIISEEQDSAKGMKIEWACEKNKSLYIGSFGKEYTSRDGSQITGEANFWVARVSESGSSDIERINWKSQYGRLREITGCTFPGYLIHEAVNWSEIRHRWFFLPRRESKEQYNEKLDEKRGTNLIIEIDEHFDKYKLTRVKFDRTDTPARGFSSFKFLPGTEDTLIIAIRSEEDDEAGILRTHISIINVDTGELVYPETQVSNEFKFEGIELW